MRWVLLLGLVAAPVVAFDGPPPASAFRPDESGFPLPKDAARRLGNPAFRVPDGAGEFRLSTDGKVLFEIAPDPCFWVVGRDPATGKLLWRNREFTREFQLTSPHAEPGKLRLLERVNYKYRFVWLDQATGKVVERGEFLDLKALLHSDRTVTVGPSDRWLLVAEHKWVNNDGVEETETYHFVHDRLGKRPPLDLGQLGRFGVIFAPDGKHAAAVGGDNDPVRVYDLTTGKAVHELRPRGQRMYGLAFSPDGKTLAAWADHRVEPAPRSKREVVLWDIATGEGRAFATFPWNFEDPSGFDVFGGPLVFTPDGKRLLVPRVGEGWVTYDLASGNRVAVAKPGPRSGYDYPLALSPDGKTMFTGGGVSDGVLPWDVATGKPTPAAPDPPGRATVLQFSPDGRLHALMGGRAVVFDPATGKELSRGEPLAATGAGCFSADGSKVAVIGGHPKSIPPHRETVVRVCDAKTGKQLAATEKTDDLLFGFALTADGTRVITITRTNFDHRGTVTEWDALTGKKLAAWEDKTDRGPGYLATLSPDGKTLVYMDANYLNAGEARVTVWDVAAPGKVGQPRKFTSHGGYSNVIGFTADGKRLVTLKTGGIDVWDVPTGRLLHIIETGGVFLNKLALSPDGTLAATASPDRLIRVFDLKTGRVAKTFVGHEGWIDALAISPDGKWLVSAGAEAPLFVWPLK